LCTILTQRPESMMGPPSGRARLLISQELPAAGNCRMHVQYSYMEITLMYFQYIL